jgi:hypothetical protein
LSAVVSFLRRTNSPLSVSVYLHSPFPGFWSSSPKALLGRIGKEESLLHRDIYVAYSFV